MADANESVTAEAKPATTAPEESGLKKFGKALARGFGKTAAYLGALAVLGGVGAFFVAVGVPALGSIIANGFTMELAAGVASTLPYFAGIIGGSAAVAAAGYFGATAAGASFDPPPPPPDTRTPLEKAIDSEIRRRKSVLDTKLRTPLRQSEIDDITEKLTAQFNGNAPRAAAETPSPAAPATPAPAPMAKTL